jgi:ribosome-associated toxin RatA of RatAB toxin-antitoxin module
MKRIVRSAIVEHSAAEMYALVDDIERYPSFLPWCRDARVEEVDGRRRATLTVGLRGLRQSFTTLNETRPGEAIDMQLVAGPFRAFTAAWQFRPLGERACAIEYAMEYELASAALARLLEPLFDHIADTMVDAFKRRADAR